MINKLNGWQRLWVLLACISLIIVVVFVVQAFPQPNKVFHSPKLIQQISTESRELFVLEDEHGWTPVADVGIRAYASNGMILPFRTGISDAQIEKARNEYELALVAVSNANRTSLIIKSATLWLVFCVGIYLLGWSVGWIRKGFYSSKP